MSANPVAQSPNSGSPGKQSPSQPAPLHPEIRSVVSLTIAHAHKIYFSGPLIRRIERQPDGQKPSRDEGWTEVWAQLGGTTLSIWDMKEIQEASRHGKEVPPAYVNVTDAFVQVLGSVTVPATATQPSKRYTNVLTLNTAGSNLLLFSCPSTNALISWASALRLSAWEKSRLEEVYTAHLIRITLNRPNAPTSLVRGKLEGWTRIRVAGQTDWKRVWMVVSAGQMDGISVGPDSTANGTFSSAQQPKRKRMSSLFSRDQIPQGPTGPVKPIITMYAGPKPKERKKPLLSFRDVTQAFAVYPERPELISRSTLIKLEGLLGDEEMAQSMKSREGWILFMPEIEGASGNQAMEMLKWVIAVHDAFDMYGRPTAWTWDPREPISLMFAYPVGPQRDLLFLDREAVESLDPRDDRTSAIRTKLLELLTERMRQQQPQLVQPRASTSRTSSEQPPTLPPISMGGSEPGAQALQNGSPSSAAASIGPQLPPLSFSGTHNQDRMLTPITEGGSIMTHGRGMSMDATTSINPTSPVATAAGQAAPDKSEPPPPVLDRGYTNSPRPTATSPPPTSPSPNVGGTSISSADVRPSVQSVRSSHSIDRVGGTASPPIQNVPKSPPPSTLPRTTSVSASVSSQSPSTTTKFETPSISASASASASGAKDSRISSNATSNQLSVTSATNEPLVSPYSPLHKPIAMALTDSRDSGERSNSPRASILTSPYSLGGDHYLAGDTISVLTSPHSIHDEAIATRASGEFQGLAQASANLHATSPPAGPGRKDSATGQTFPPSASARKPSGGTHEPEDNFLNEAGALYFMHQSRLEGGGDAVAGGVGNKQPRQVPMPTASDDEEDEEEEESESEEEFPKPPGAGLGLVASGNINNKSGRSPPVRQATPLVFGDRAQPASTSASASPKSPLGIAQAQAHAGPSSPPPPPRMSPMAAVGMPGSSQPLSPVAPLRFNHDRSGSVAGAGMSANNNAVASSSSSTRAGLGRKPSGARAQANSRMPPYNGTLPASHHSQQLTEEEEEEEGSAAASSANTDDQKTTTNMQAIHQRPPLPTSISAGSATSGNNASVSSPAPPPPQPPKSVFNNNNSNDDSAANEDVLAALSYLNVADGDATGTSGSDGQHQPPLSASSMGSGPQQKEQQQFKSSFAPSSSAAKRKAKAQAQQAAHHAATHKPGRANGRKKSKVAGAWNDSSDEEDEDDEDEDEDADSDVDPVAQRMQGSASSHGQQGRPSVYGQLAGDMAGQQGPPPHLRAPRTLPQPPSSSGSRPGTDDHHNNYAQPRRLPSDQFSDRRTYYGDDGTQIRLQSEVPQPGAARQTVWSQVLDPGRNVNPLEQNTRDTFVQLEPSETMTKAFTPQGLLSAGLQDRQDRSAKRQEELARETGASLINVPNKPPPPQTGLLGAITAHERERKREGGVGAALTEREREKRLAEERQRRFDEQQRQQMEQMQQGGSMYGGYGYNPMMNPMMMGMNPMMMNPMMTGGLTPMMTGGGMNPMMTGGGMNPMMGYPGMLNPQQMYAAQQAAAAAYQQAMMAFSTTGSQVGGEGGQPGMGPMGPHMSGGGMSPIGQNMSGGGMSPMGQNMAGGGMSPMGQNMTGGGMPGFDPRMSMMSMPMMGGMGGMGGGSGMGMGMAPTMSGNFDSRFPPGAGGSPSGSGAHGENGGLLPPGGHTGPSSQTNSPIGRGSPLVRPTDGGNDRPGTPKH